MSSSHSSSVFDATLSRFVERLKYCVNAPQPSFDITLSNIDFHYTTYEESGLDISQITDAFDYAFKHYCSDLSNRSSFSKYVKHRFRLLLLLSHLTRPASDILQQLKKQFQRLRSSGSNSNKPPNLSFSSYKDYLAHIHSAWQIHEKKTTLQDIERKLGSKCYDLAKDLDQREKLTSYVKNYIIHGNVASGAHIDTIRTRLCPLWNKSEPLRTGSSVKNVEKMVSQCKREQEQKDESKNGNDWNTRNARNDGKKDVEMEYVYHRQCGDPLTYMGSAILGNWPVQTEYDGQNRIGKLMEETRKQQKHSRSEDQLKKEKETLDDEFEKFWNENYNRWCLVDDYCLDERIWDWRVKIKYSDEEIEQHVKKASAMTDVAANNESKTTCHDTSTK